jgi:hypothetical protein
MDEKFKWALKVFPLGTESAGNNAGGIKQVAAFVELVPEAGLEPWTMKGVRYEITLINWKDELRSVTKEHTFTFSNKEADNGWHKGWCTNEAMTLVNGWLNEQGELGFRACIDSRQTALYQPLR